jgi:hypothetical protein
VGVFRGAIDSVIELDRLLVKRGDTVHILRGCGFIQLNKKSRVYIGTAGHAPVSPQEHCFRQQIIGSNQEAKVRQRPETLSHGMKIAHVQAAILQPYDVGLFGSLDHRCDFDPEARV